MEVDVPLAFLTHEEFSSLSRAREVIVSVRTINLYDRRYIPDGPSIVASLTNLGIAFCKVNRLREAEEILLYAIKIQECIDHRMHQDLLRPLVTLGALFARQRRFDKAEPTLLRALMIVGKTDAKIDEHRLILVNLVHVYQELNRNDDRGRMKDCLTRLLDENPFVVKDRHSKPSD
jgi:hypothetical protein